MSVIGAIFVSIGVLFGVTSVKTARANARRDEERRRRRRTEVSFPAFDMHFVPLYKYILRIYIKHENS